MSQIHQQTNPDRCHIVDTFPLPVCRNIRIKRCHIYRDEAFRGYCASKKEYYFGLKVCVIVTQDGDPVELLLSPGSTADITALRSMDLNLPDRSTLDRSTLFGDTGFLDQDFEEALGKEAGINLVVPRRKNMKDQLDGCLQYICCFYPKGSVK